VTQELSTSIVTLIEANAALTRQLEAKQKRIDFLEFVLQQRAQETQKSFNPAAMGVMCQKCYTVFLEHSGVGYTYEEFNDAFKDRWQFESAHLPQRLRDLRQMNLIWSTDHDGSTPVTFYLKLKEKT
jgi:hypothetical protein